MLVTPEGHSELCNSHSLLLCVLQSWRVRACMRVCVMCVCEILQLVYNSEYFLEKSDSALKEHEYKEGAFPSYRVLGTGLLLRPPAAAHEIAAEEPRRELVEPSSAPGC